VVTLSFVQRSTSEEILRLVVSDSGEYEEILGNASWIDFAFKPVSANLGRLVSFQDDAEEWARSLPSAYENSPLEVTVLKDTGAPPPLPPDLAAPSSRETNLSANTPNPLDTPNPAAPALGRRALARRRALERTEALEAAKALRRRQALEKREAHPQALSGGGILVIVIIIGAVLWVAGAFNISTTSTPAPSPTPLTLSGVGRKQLGTITVPIGGAKMYWSCPACDGIYTVLKLTNADSDANELGTSAMISPFQDHSTYGANNSVQPGAYHNVIADAENGSGPGNPVGTSWTIRIVPNIVGQTIMES
jgi:hypothetical protein